MISPQNWLTYSIDKIFLGLYAFLPLNRWTMGKGKRKARQAARQQKEAKQVLTITLVSTLALLVILYIMFANT